MANTIPVTKAYTALPGGSVDFDLRDQKGRAIGYRWTIKKVVATPIDVTAPDAPRSYYTLPEGFPFHYYEICTNPTRDGVRYGPAFNWANVATFAEAEALVTKRTNAARKSNTKKFGKAA